MNVLQEEICESGFSSQSMKMFACWPAADDLFCHTITFWHFHFKVCHFQLAQCDATHSNDTQNKV